MLPVTDGYRVKYMAQNSGKKYPLLVRFEVPGFLVHGISQNAYCSQYIYLQFTKYLSYVVLPIIIQINSNEAKQSLLINQWPIVFESL